MSTHLGYDVFNAEPIPKTGTVVKAGPRVGFTEGVVTDSSGALVATASSTLIIFDTNDASR
jgi:acyl-coenzyme A thioesterase PaaI-like protein